MEDREIYGREAPNEVTAEELSLARDVFKTLTKTIKTLNVYPKQNPIAQKFLEELTSKFDSFLNTYGDLKLKVDQFSLLHKGEEVFYSEERQDNLALYLFLDGVREFSFLTGLTREEIETFLDIVMSVPKQANPEDDIVTLLWEKELPHINYFVPEEISDEEGFVAEEFLGGAQEEAASHTVQGATYSDLTIIPAGLEIDVAPMSDDEAKALRSELLGVESETRLRYTSDMFMDLMEEEQDISDFALYARGLSSLAEIWVGRNNTEGVLGLLKEVAGMLSSVEDDNRKAELLKVVGKLSGPETINWFLAVCKEKAAVEEYLALIGPHAVDSLVSVLAEIGDRKLRRFICSVLAGPAGRDPSIFGKYLDDERWYLVRNIVMILGMGKNAGGVRLIEKAASNPEARVRRECVKSLETIGTEEIRKSLMLLLADSDSATRTFALKALKRLGGDDLYDHVKSFVVRDDFKARPFPEKREFLEALGVFGGERAFPLLRDLFKKKGLIFRQDENLEMRAAAAYGLGYIATAEAVELLRKGADSRKSLLREACVSALKSSTETAK